MRQYLDLLQYIKTNGKQKDDRTNTGTISVFGTQMRFDLNEGFPLVTTKKVFFKAVVHELLWFLKGTGNIQYLKDNNITIWDEWANEQGDLGPVYGVQWRAWKGADGRVHDQIKKLIETLKKDPSSRRHIVSAWNVGEMDQMALSPCHAFIQFDVTRGRLSCQFQMRSIDSFLGLPFNIASYALLTMMIAQVCNLKLGDLIFVGGDTHIYSNHFEQVDLQLTRAPYPLPRVALNYDVQDIDDFKFEDIMLMDYRCHEAIKAPIAV